MVISHYANIISLIYSVLSYNCFKSLGGYRKKFITTASGCFSSPKVKKNFLHFGCFTNRSGQHSASILSKILNFKYLA
jgi:hypothetical protein